MATLEQAIARGNELIERMRREGRDAVGDDEVHDVLAALRSARTASVQAKSTRKKAPAAPVDLDAIFS